MKFIDLNSLSTTLSRAKKFYVDLSYISAITVEYIDVDNLSAGITEPGWMVGVTTPLGFTGISCKDEAEAEEIGLKLVHMVEEVRALPLKTHVGTASDMMDRLGKLK